MKPASPRSVGTAASLLVLLALLAQPLAARADTQPKPTPTLKTLLVQAGAAGQRLSFDGQVEALRQTVLAAQVAGAVVQLDVKAGDRVKAGQVLMRIDARAAEQATAVSEAQAQSARAALQLASQELERQQRLFKQNYISQAALDQAEAQFKAAQAQANAQLAQVAVARTQSGLSIVRSPYDGVIAELPVTLGDMAMPGRPLATVYDPAALRVTAHLPQSLASSLSVAEGARDFRIEIPGLGAAGAAITALRVQLLPTADAVSQTMQLRLDLPAKPSGVVPGMFARVSLPAASAAGAGGVPAANIWVPRTALVRRAELDGLYVIAASGKPLLRQIRLGAVRGDQVEVLSGLSAGERIALEPQVAAQVR
ncbi:efflux RND transporter periplasmic adaptor subunit [Roseateles sp.]|uniref:efflux RND transporter periplasmic adaptor subunit n=1 Tax=Roseateles sp. TaxID=1971397 RepID=UPI00286A7E8D|nr:efflux RND transporter periplasmic adaptor subunit [Roseateles sp.]